MAQVAAALAAAIVGGKLLSFLLSRCHPALENLSRDQAVFADTLPASWVPWAIVASAGSSLALELAIIRWQGTVWEIFAFYKNFGLLACFAGLGLGYALAKRESIPLVFTLPLLALQMILLIGMRHEMGHWRWTSL